MTEEFDRSTPLLKSCTTCGEKIAASARKCIHCDSYQDWRRYLTFSSTILALLIALVSVTTSAVSVFWSLLGSKDSNLIGSFHGFSNNEAVFVVSNSGSRPGTVAEAGIRLNPILFRDGDAIGLDRGVLVDGLPLAPKYRDESFFVDVGQSRVLKYQSNADAKELFGKFNNFEKMATNKWYCVIYLDLINFSGKRDHRDFELNCRCLAKGLFDSEHYGAVCGNEEIKAIPKR